MSDGKTTRPPPEMERPGSASKGVTTAPAPPDDESGATTVRHVTPPRTSVTIAETRPVGRNPAPVGTRYSDEGKIAEGGMSTIHRVFDSLILRRIAMKALRSDRRAAELTRFIEEAQITGQLDHPNILPVYDMQTDPRGVPSRIAMKLVEGETLHELAQRAEYRDLSGQRLEQLVQVVIKICDAVAFAHSRGVIHRDLKPSNIMVGSHGQVYVMDWGIALVRHGLSAPESREKLPTIQIGTPGGTEEAHGSLSGTPAYMAPEQALGLIDSIDERTDIYGLGGILYFLLTLKPPHDGGSIKADLEMAKFTEVVHPTDNAHGRTLPPGLCRIAMRALAGDPDERYASADAMKADLESFLRGGGWLEQRRFARKTVIIREGERADAAYIITDGQCELHKTVHGEPRFVRLMGPGEAFGETAIFGSTPRTATVVAAVDVTLLVVTREALERELDRNTWVRSFVEAMAERFVELDRRAARLEQALANAGGDQPAAEPDRKIDESP